MQIEQAKKAGIASGLARQSPKLIADKIKASEMHLAGLDTGAICRSMPDRQRTEIRRWLIAAGIYRTKGRGKANEGRRHFNASAIIAAQYAKELKQLAAMDDCQHWRRHTATRRNSYKGMTDKIRANARAWSKANWRSRITTSNNRPFLQWFN